MDSRLMRVGNLLFLVALINLFSISNIYKKGNN
ncbi:hypothetical protein Cop2CBH44_23850 [Coprobacter secundus subsp. similis]|uniref:Uncharacterized protein n=1 Tax=Coprobacter secundus subsp. similis TaxID=2751153 RepID=A0A7G1HYW3_9BACT|nr:hypothetical protein Cop2CBH44_23850 [Coprobacter secundus subsp. similis]